MGIVQLSAKDRVRQALGQHFDALNLVETEITSSEIAPSGTAPLGTTPLGASWSFADPCLDAAIPPHVRKIGGLHEVVPQCHQDAPAAVGFALALATCFSRKHVASSRSCHNTSPSILWCSYGRNLQEWGPLYGPGLASFGLEPKAFLHLRLNQPNDLLWALEEGLKNPAIDLVVGEIDRVSLNASRRLALLANAHQRSPILLKSAGFSAAQGGGSSAAWARWQIAAQPSPHNPFNPQAPGHTRWRVELVRSKSAPPGGRWLLEWGPGAELSPAAAVSSNAYDQRTLSDVDIKDDDPQDHTARDLERAKRTHPPIATHRFRLVSKLADRSTPDVPNKQPPARHTPKAKLIPFAPGTAFGAGLDKSTGRAARGRQ